MIDQTPIPLYRSPSLAGNRTPWLARLGAAANRFLDGATGIMRREMVLPGVLGGLLGRTPLFESLFPLATAYFVALLVAGERRRALAAATGILFGMATLVPGPRVMEQFALLLAVWLIAVNSRSRRPQRLWMLPLGAALSALCLRGVLLLVAGSGTEALLWLGAEIALEFTAAIVLVPAMVLHRGWPQKLEPVQLAGPVLALSLFILAAEGMHVAGYAVDGVIGRWGILIGALVGGPAVGAAIGAGVGLIATVAAGGVTLLVGLYPAAGLLAGLGSVYGKPGVVAGLFITHLLLSTQAGSFSEIAAWLAEAGLATVLLIFTPRWLIARLAVSVPTTRSEPEHSPYTDTQPTEQVVDHLNRISQVFDELARTFGTVTHHRGEPGKEGFDVFLQGVTERICTGCRAYNYCWEENLYYSYRDLVDLGAVAERKQPLGWDDLPRGLQQRCVQPRQLLQAAQDTCDSLRVDSYWQRRLEESRDIVPRQLRGIAQIVHGLAEQVARDVSTGTEGFGGITAPAEEEGNRGGARKWTSSAPTRSGYRAGPRLQLDVVTRRLAKDGSMVSGDSHAQVDLGGGKAALILSDGMGVGTRAALESQAAVSMLRRLMEAGFNREFAVRTVNSVLLLRSVEETFATIDLTVFDLLAGEVEFLKIGAAPTFIKRGREVEVIQSASPPVGIMQRIDVQPQTTRLAQGDVIVMVTDGLLDALRHESRGEDWVAQILRRAPATDPADIAERLLERITQAHPQGLPDDVTIVVARSLAAAIDVPPPDPAAIPVYHRT